MKYAVLILFVGFVCQGKAGAQQATPSTAPEGAASDEVVDYEASFFRRYSPNTALDMIRQVPGFQLDDGDASRGLGAASGNILINDRRPSAKQDLPSEILSRIPASQVLKIELIQGQVRDIDLQGQSVIANLILKADSPAAISWDASWRYNFDFKSTFEGGISISDQWHEIDYNAGIDLRYFTRGDFTFQDKLNGDEELIEKRTDYYFADGIRGAANLNTASTLGESFIKFNTTLSWEDREGLRQIREAPQPNGNGFQREFIAEDFKLRQIEVGADIERYLLPDLQATAIALFIRSREDAINSLRRSLHTRRPLLLRIGDEGAKSTEAITRLEFDWTGLRNHTLQANLEGAFNVLDGTLFQTEDRGNGPIEVDIIGANTRVEEVRGDFLLKDTWSLGQFELDYGMGAEVSTITQTGDAEQERTFFFLKPQTVLTHNPGPGQQSRLRVSREVSQLDFADFVSTTVFEDDDLALGNPDLRPDTTWVAEATHERRFGPQSVLKIVVFHHWISNVLDLLPLTATSEGTGNIGNGQRWGVEMEATIPMEWIGLQGARLDLIGRWQDSSVTDPVTGEKRVLSDRTPSGRLMPLVFDVESEYVFAVDYRQDFQAQKFAWGWDVRTRAERPKFKVNELDIQDEGTEINAFVETTRFFGLKTILAVENILDISDTRDRTVYTGGRDLSPVQFQELRDRYRSMRVSLSVSGSF